MIPLIKPAVRLSPKHLWKNIDRAPSQACHPTHSTIFPQTAFAQIQVILAKAGDVIAAEHIQIEKIGKQHIDFLRWDNDPHCKATTPFQLKF